MVARMTFGKITFGNYNYLLSLMTLVTSMPFGNYVIELKIVVISNYEKLLTGSRWRPR